MAKVEIKNIIAGRISPRNDITMDMDERNAFELMIEVVKNLKLNGWWIHDIFENEQFKGFVLKIIDKCDCELAVSVHIKKF